MSAGATSGSLLLTVVGVVAAGLAAGLAVPARPTLRRAPPPPGHPDHPDHHADRHPDHHRVDEGWLRRHRPWWCALAACAAGTFLGGAVGVVAGAVAAGVVWVVVGRSEPPAVRREREAVARDLPHVVGLLAAAVRAGHAPGPALAVVCTALPGPAADRLAVHPPRLLMGLDPAEVWQRLGDDPGLAPLGRALARAHDTGAPIGDTLARLGEELSAAARADVEDRARRVGVRAAVPLGLCLLPAFVLLGIVPLVAGLASSLRLG